MSNTLDRNTLDRNHFAEKAAAAPLGSPERAELEGIVAEFDAVIAFESTTSFGGLTASEPTPYFN